ncbi:MAG: riboflavin synthase, partial [Oscillospiraceae bacterium]|nr:riboflavin synthase [Oscillospiraceae bacterium]
MFTGIVEEVGKVLSITKSVNGAKLTIGANIITRDIGLGDSVAVNGVCLTITDIKSNLVVADVMNETLKKSMLNELVVGNFVNLERALTLNSRLGGHIVTGHIDGVGKIENIKKDGIGIWYKIKVDSEILKYIIKKGSVCINGVSLTVTEVDYDSFKVCIIPHTHNNTTISALKKGNIVNIENDIIGKYVD